MEKNNLTSPIITTTNPAPADKYTSVTGRSKSSGTPFKSGSPLSDKAVLDIQTGKLPKP